MYYKWLNGENRKKENEDIIKEIKKENPDIKEKELKQKFSVYENNFEDMN